MTHPDDQLAEYEDGALADGERAVLERHLASCARCRDQVALARAARAALAAVPDADAPTNIGDRAIEEAGKGRAGAAAWYRWGGVAVAAAAAIILVSVLLPKVGSKSDLRAVPAAAGESASSHRVAEAATGIENQDTNYDAESIAAIAASYRGSEWRVAAKEAAPATPQPVSRGTSFDANVGSATECLRRASSGAGGELVRLIRARYSGTPAYIGVYLVGPGADQPADSVRVLVVPIGSCTTILSSAAAKL